MFNWISFLTYVLVTAITPGPNNIMSLTNGSRVGFRRALPFNFGVLVGFSGVALVCTLLSSVLFEFLPVIKLPMMIIGALYMLYLAWKTFKSGSVEEGTEVKVGFWQAVALQFINVKAYIYAIVSMEAFILPHFAGNIPVLLGFALLLALIGFVCTVCWTAFGTIFKLLFSKHGKIVNTIMALLLIYCAVSLFL